MRRLFEGIEVKESEGCGANNMLAVMSTMVTTGIIMDELGMFPDYEEEVEAMLFLDPERAFIPSDELDDYDSLDPLQILLAREESRENGENGLPKKYTVMKDRLYYTVTPFPIDAAEIRAMMKVSRSRIFFHQNARLLENGHDPKIVPHKYDRGYRSPKKKALPPMFRISRSFKDGVVEHKAVPVTV